MREINKSFVSVLFSLFEDTYNWSFDREKKLKKNHVRVFDNEERGISKRDHNCWPENNFYKISLNSVAESDRKINWLFLTFVLADSPRFPGSPPQPRPQRDRPTKANAVRVQYNNVCVCTRRHAEEKFSGESL